MAEYNHKDIEPKWQDFWDKDKSYKVDGVKKNTKKLFVLDMFPYPSGSGLHMGHPLGYTATDIFSRYHRMQGYSVLHPMGWDAFGLPAEQHAIKTGEHPANITEANCAVFRGQLRKLGFSYDWDREIFTCKPEYYKWTQWIFLKIYNAWFDEEQQKARHISQLPVPQEIKTQGDVAVSQYRDKHRLAYHKEALVNFCPELGTVLANEEVKDGLSEVGGFPVIRKPMKQWVLRITKYSERLLKELDLVNWPENIKEQQRNWIGKNHGTEIKFKVADKDISIEAFTTRPDTLFGVTFFVLSPEHPAVNKIMTPDYARQVTKYCEDALKLSDFQRTLENRKKTGVFTGGYVINPINQEKVPVYVGDYVLMSYGTGAVMGVPAHDERDFEFARMFQIDICPVIHPKEASLDVMTAVEEGEIAWTESGVMCDIDHANFRSLGLAKIENEKAKEIITNWLVENNAGSKVVTYRIRDWLFSRQRYWGEPIPIIHWENGTISALDESELPLVLPQVEDFKPSTDGESPLAKAKDWLHVICPKTGLKGRRETNTMPQWAGSCWYYLRFADPHNSKAAWDPQIEKDWMPVDLYVGGAEHAVLHLLYARFWHKVLFDLGLVSTAEPFQRLYNQGMILSQAYKNKRGVVIPVDEVKETTQGVYTHMKTGEEVERITAKMSKSLRNVVTPDEMIQIHGADTLRMYLMFMGPLDSTRMWDTQAIAGTSRFLRRSWTFVTGDKDSGFRDTVDSATESQEVKRALNKTIKKVGEDIQDLHLNTAIAAMMEFMNAVGGEKVSKETFEKFVCILSPFAPHACEEMWRRLGHATSVSQASWPQYDEKYLESNKATVVVQVNGKKRSVLEVGIDVSESDLKANVISSLANTEHKVASGDRFITVYQPGTKVPRLVNVITK